VVLEIKCFVETKNEVLTLIVDDIMSFFSDVGVIVHSNDKRYKKHIGKKIILSDYRELAAFYARLGGGEPISD